MTVLIAAGLGGSRPAAARVQPSQPARSHRRADAPTRCLVPGTRRTLDELWRPDLGAAIRYARRRRGDIAFAVRTDGRFYGYRPDHDEWSASVVKAMLLVSYLDQPSIRGRALSPSERRVIGPMIEASDNDDAQEVFDTVGQAGLRALANRVGMSRFATNPVWGETSVTARDQTKFFLHIERYIAPLHRSYALRLLRSIVPWERWGIGELAPRGWRLYFKGGWGYATGLLDHQVALLVRGCARVSIAVLTMYDGSHAYGKATLKGIFARLLARFPEGARGPGRELQRAGLSEHHLAPPAQDPATRHAPADASPGPPYSRRSRITASPLASPRRKAARGQNTQIWKGGVSSGHTYLAAPDTSRSR